MSHSFIYQYDISIFQNIWDLAQDEIMKTRDDVEWKRK